MTKICSLSDPNYRKKLVETLDIISDTVTSTLGPNGKTCILYDGDVTPHVTKDGVTVAEFIKFKDPFQEAINKIVKETARKTGENIGDGTTTSILLACKLVEKLFNTKGNAIEELEKVENSITNVIKNLSAATIKLNTFSEDAIDILQSIVYLSSNGDKEITKSIVDTLNVIGADGLIDVMLSNNEIGRVDIQEGILIESPAHVNKSINLNLPYVVLVSTSIEKTHQVKTCMQLALNLFKDTGRSMIIIAKEFSKEVQDVIAMNNRSNRFSVFLVESDGFAANMFEILDDMASLLNCKILSTDSYSDFGLQNITVDHIAHNVKSAIITPNHTVLQGDNFLTEANLEIKNSLVAEIIKLKNEGCLQLGSISNLEKRLSKFSKSATIYVGGYTEAEKLEKKDRVDDAVKALASAVNNGVVPGGGYALYHAGKDAESDIVQYICKLPGFILSQNLTTDIYKVYDEGHVMDFATGEVGEAIDLGILDPANVSVKALQQAMIIVRLLLNTHSIIIPDDGEV